MDVNKTGELIRAHQNKTANQYVVNTQDNHNSSSENKAIVLEYDQIRAPKESTYFPPSDVETGPQADNN